MSADAVESAARQAETDSAALALAEQRLTAIIGAGPPGGLAKNGSMLQELASGKIKLLRATFPAGSASGPGAGRFACGASRCPVARRSRIPRKAGRLKFGVGGAGRCRPSRDAVFLRLLENSDAGEGERLLVWAPGAGPSQQGVARSGSRTCDQRRQVLVLCGAKAQCVREAPNRHRTAGCRWILRDRGDRSRRQIVTAAAGLLLARETNPSTEAD